MIGLHPITEELVGRFSNSNVENYYKIIKHRLQQSKGHLKVGRVIKVLWQNVTTTLNIIRINTSDYNKESKKRKTHKQWQMMPYLMKLAKNVNKEMLPKDNVEPEK